MTDRSRAPLAPNRAILQALLGNDIDHYPRISKKDGTNLLSSDEIILEFCDATEHWSGTSDLAGCPTIDDAIKLARQSLDEVKGQTEYQDQKATRLLTVTTFLTVLSGVLFTRLLDAYPLQSFYAQPWWAQLILAVSYLLFGAFVFNTLFGALVTFHATRTRFKYPRDDGSAADSGAPRSRLFYQGILYASPSAWALEYISAKDETQSAPKINPALKQAYLRDLVVETYLVAAKAADKLRFLDPAQRLLARSLTCLLLWLVSLAAIPMVVPIPHTRPTAVRLEAPTGPLPVEARITFAPTSATPPTSPQPPSTSAASTAAPLNAH